MLNKFKMSYDKIVALCGIIIGGLLISIYMIGIHQEDKTVQLEKNNSEIIENQVVTCDGIIVTENCIFEGEEYLTYKYYPYEEEKYHIETITTYTKEVVGRCTLCKDGTRSPSCATGKGACSHHGGVAEWNAPIYKDVAHKEEKKVIDEPAKEERYEKVLKEN